MVETGVSAVAGPDGRRYWWLLDAGTGRFSAIVLSPASLRRKWDRHFPTNDVACQVEGNPIRSSSARYRMYFNYLEYSVALYRRIRIKASIRIAKGTSVQCAP